MDKAKSKLDKSFVEYIVDQIQELGNISYKYMFGGCAIYCGHKVVALICANQLFVRPTLGGRKLIGKVNEQPPYPGAKPHFLIEDEVEDKEWLTNLIKVTAAEIAEPAPKRIKK